MPPYGSYGGPQYTGRNRQASDGGPSGVQRSTASSFRESEALFSTYEHLQGLPRADAALTMLRKIASIVKPIMRKRGWRVQVLAEFLPTEQNLLGLNINKGYKICVRLRYHNNPDLFLPLEQVTDTMLHELSHNVWGEHDSKFHALWDELRDEHETLLRKGYTGEGFLGEGRKLGGMTRLPPQHEMRNMARASAEKRKTQGALAAGSGRRLGGAPIHHGQDVREVIAGQALLRTTTNRGCGSGRKDAIQISDESSSQSFKTKAEEDDANDRAIAQAIYELMEEEETAKLNRTKTFQAAPKDGGLGWSKEHGLYHADDSKPSQSKGSHERQPTEEEQMEWALQQSMQSAASGDTDTNGLPPESLVSPVSPVMARTAASDSHARPEAAFSPVSPLGQEQIERAAIKRKREDKRNDTSIKSEPSASLTLIDLSEPFDPDVKAPDQWACQICTCINPVQYLACDACGVERPQSLSFRSRREQASRSATPKRPPTPTLTPAKTGSLGWNCGSCGTFMEHKWWTCSACGTMKTSS